MGKTQIRYLKLLGYKNTQEDGATLEHPSLTGMGRYVWRGDAFESVLANYSERLVVAERGRLAHKILSNG